MREAEPNREMLARHRKAHPARFAATLLAASFVAAAGAGACFAQSTSIPAYVTQALASSARPEADRNADASRKPAELIAIAGLKPGDKALELIPGGGYVTRIFSAIVGPSGHVHALVSAEETKTSMKAAEAVQAIAADPQFGNVTVQIKSIVEASAPEKVDLVWTSQNYHDFHDKSFGPADMMTVNKSIFNALKPGGVYMVIDHAAAPGSGTRDTETLHRIDPAAAIAEITAAGFTLETQSDILRDPEDDHTKRIFDPVIRGKTDKFVLKFRRPAEAK
jgi:predicted methyltransferase